MNTILYDYVCDELADVEKEGLKASNLDSTDKLLSIKKNLLKIEKLEDEGYSMDGGRWAAEGEYSGDMDDYSGARRGEHWVRGHYSRDSYRDYDYRMPDRMSYRGGSSYARKRDRRGRYSRADAKDTMMSKLGEMMPMADGKQREILEHAMHRLEET